MGLSLGQRVSVALEEGAAPVTAVIRRRDIPLDVTIDAAVLVEKRDMDAKWPDLAEQDLWIALVRDKVDHDLASALLEKRFGAESRIR